MIQLPPGFNEPSDSQRGYAEESELKALTWTPEDAVDYFRDQWNGGNENFWPAFAQVILDLQADLDREGKRAGSGGP